MQESLIRDYNQRSISSRKSNGFCSGLIAVGFIISVGIVLYSDQGDCNIVPLRLWLKVFGLSNFVNLMFSCMCEICLIEKVGKFMVYKVVYLLFMLFEFGWIFTGIYWFFHEPGCEDKFPDGYMLTKVFAYIFLIFSGIIGAIIVLAVLSAFKRKRID